MYCGIPNKTYVTLRRRSVTERVQWSTLKQKMKAFIDMSSQSYMAKAQLQTARKGIDLLFNKTEKNCNGEK